jgi:broad specificity phosphatase PhoE
MLARRLRSERIESIYSSPLRRAADTARAIAESTGLSVVPMPQLKEIGCGEIEGQPIELVRQKYRTYWEANLRQEDPDFHWPGGESYREFRARCLTGIAHIAAGHHAQRVAVVTHAGVICQLIGHVRDTSPAQWEAFRPGTASVTVLEWKDGCGTLLVFDDRAHLHDLHRVTRTENQP